MSKKSSKLKEISEMFKEINIDFNKLKNKGINDMITIIRRQNDERYQPNVKHKLEDIVLITFLVYQQNVMNRQKQNHLQRKKKSG